MDIQTTSYFPFFNCSTFWTRVQASWSVQKPCASHRTRPWASTRNAQPINEFSYQIWIPMLSQGHRLQSSIAIGDGYLPFSCPVVLELTVQTATKSMANVSEATLIQWVEIQVEYYNPLCHNKKESWYSVINKWTDVNLHDVRRAFWLSMSER
jgi:hypothetical protein